MSASVETTPRGRAALAEVAVAWARRNTWTIGLIGLLVVFLSLTKLIQPNYGAPGIQGLAISILPIAFAAVAQAIVVISGGIDLSVGSVVGFTTVFLAVVVQTLLETDYVRRLEGSLSRKICGGDGAHDSGDRQDGGGVVDGELSNSPDNVGNAHLELLGVFENADVC